MENKSDKSFHAFTNPAEKWIKNFEDMLSKNEIESRDFQSSIQNFINIKEKYGIQADTYIEKRLNNSKAVQDHFNSGKESLLGKMFDYKKIKEDILTNKDLLKKVTILSSAEQSFKDKYKSNKTIDRPKQKPKEPSKNKSENAFTFKIKSDVYKSKGLIYNQDDKNKTIEDLIDKKTKQIEYDDIISFEEFAKSFSKHARESEVQEALSWFATYIKSDDFSKNDIIRIDGVVDKDKTIINIAEKINERAITPYTPFTYNKSNGSLIYNQATSSAVDVMLFIENSQKIVGASATKDRTFKIEGNQFIRHNYKLKAMGVLLENEILNDENLRSKSSIKASDVRRIVNKESFTLDLNTRSVIIKLGKKLNTEVLKNASSRRKSEFTSHLSIIREYIRNKDGIDLHKNGLKITKREIGILDNVTKFDGDYHFFGEIAKKFDFPELMAGLNKISYKENFKDVSSFSMDNESVSAFLETMKYNYNNASDLKYSDNYAHRFIHDIISTKSETRGLDTLLSEGYSYKEEREVVFKSLSTIINEINDLDVISHANVLGVFKLNLKTLNSEELNDLTKSILSGEASENIIKKTSTIKLAQSEVASEYRELKNSLNALSSNIELTKSRDILNEIEKLGGMEELMKQIDLLKQIKDSSNNDRKEKNSFKREGP